MSKPAHTPGPWRQHQTEADAIVGPDRKPIAMVSALGKRPDEEDDANLAHIIRAVNAHDALVAALKMAKQLLDPLVQRTRTWTCTSQHNYLATWMIAEPEEFARRTTDEEKAQARAALTAAQGA